MVKKKVIPRKKKVIPRKKPRTDSTSPLETRISPSQLSTDPMPLPKEEEMKDKDTVAYDPGPTCWDMPNEQLIASCIRAVGDPATGAPLREKHFESNAEALVDQAFRMAQMINKRMQQEHEKLFPE